MDEDQNRFKTLLVFFVFVIVGLFVYGSSKHEKQRRVYKERQSQNLSNHGLKLNDRVSIGDDMSIRRVEGGLIYSRHGRYGTDSVFVPDARPIKETTND